MANRCESCYYHCAYDGACDFYLMTTVRRGCPAANCTRYRKRETRRVTRLNYSINTAARENRNSEIYRKRKQGAAAKDLAQEYGLTVHAIYNIITAKRREEERKEALHEPQSILP